MSYVIKREICSCCHMCDLQCPAGAIHMKGNKYYIEPDDCIDCGLCAENCHNKAIYNPDIPEKEPVKHEKITKECDILVLGGGASGITAAAKIADSGKKVIVMEKNWEVGGSAYFGHMMRVHYSKWHEQAGLKDPRPDLYKKFVEKTEGRVNNELVKKCLDADADIANWLIDIGELQKGFSWGTGRMGSPDIVYTYHDDYNDLRSDPATGPKDSGWYITNLLADIVKDRGGEILFNTQAVKILEENGRVVGVLGKDPGGEVEVRAKAVIVATGTYTRNKEIMDKMQPCFYRDFEENPIHIYAAATCTGDGITMCEEIGADIDYENKRSCIFGPIHHPFSYPVLMMTRPTEQSTVLVNKFGDYIDTSEMFGMHEIGLLENKPGRMAWSIIDAQAWQEGLNFYAESKDPDDHMGMRYLDRDLKREIEDGSVVVANTLEELEEKLGFEKGKLENVIKMHNEKMANRPKMDLPPADPDDFMAQMMARMPKGHPIGAGPYYAIYEGCFQENAIGGMTIDENAHILRNGQPIKGLYGCGDTTRGIMLSGDIGVAFIEMVLSAMTFAMTSGYVAANAAMEELK